MSKYLSVLIYFSFLVSNANSASFDYGSALTKSLLYFEAQRSGKLPANQRVQWRGDSALNDGKDVGIDLVGGYYDAGDNVKFGFPMAFTVTMLSWSVVEFRDRLVSRNELQNALAAIRWGTDFLIKAHPQPNVLYGQVGEGHADHSCWQRPEDMTTPRTSYKIDEEHPGADLAGETAAAFAAAALAFGQSDPSYHDTLIRHAKQLFDFATKNEGKYQNSIPAQDFYSSSGFQDELVWAAAWLALATKEAQYLDYASGSDTGNTRTMFSWDDKYVGAQVLITKSVMDEIIAGNEGLIDFKFPAEKFICNCIQKGDNNIQMSSKGLLQFLPSNNLQYVTTATFVVAAYAQSLDRLENSIRCPGGEVISSDLVAFVQSQVDYILGNNPQGLSYMVGFGSNYVKRAHHRGASIVSIKKNSSSVGCQQGFDSWFNVNADNANVIDGAIVGGPGPSDQYDDSRQNYNQAEPATANVAPLVGVLALLAALT